MDVHPEHLLKVGMPHANHTMKKIMICRAHVVPRAPISSQRREAGAQGRREATGVNVPGQS